MKKALALAVVMVFCAAIGFAAHGEHGTATEATITKVDMAGKSMVVKTADGKDMTIYWNDTTKLQGRVRGGVRPAKASDPEDVRDFIYPRLIDAGHLHLAVPPLYRLMQGAKSVYARNDAHKEVLLKSAFKGNGKIEISRFKGLGEMMASQLKETTMDPRKRTLLQVVVETLEQCAKFIQ